MHNWFECKISYEKKLENGTSKKVTEPYLVDALSFTEAEARICEKLKDLVPNEFTITDIKRAKFAEIFFNESGDRYFKAKVNFILLDEKRGIEKKTPVTMLAQASDIDEAREVINEGMKGTQSDWSLENIGETKIVDIFTYIDGQEEKNN